MTVDEAKKWFQTLAQSSGLAEGDQAAVLKAMDNEKFSKGIVDSVMARPEFSRAMDEIATERKKLQDWYSNDAKPAYDANVAGQELLARYREAYGELDDPRPTAGGVPAGDGPDVPFKTREEFQRFQSGVVSLIKTMNRISSQHLKEFDEVLDVDALEKHAIDHNLPPEAAYSDWIRPRRDEIKQKEFETRLKAAKEEGAREALSKVNLPVDVGPKEFSPLFDQRKAPSTDTEADHVSEESFVRAYNDWAMTTVRQNQQ